MKAKLGGEQNTKGVWKGEEERELVLLVFCPVCQGDIIIHRLKEMTLGPLGGLWASRDSHVVCDYKMDVNKSINSYLSILTKDS